MTLQGNTSLRASELQQVDGPACGVGESCPAFAASAWPLRVGVLRETTRDAGAPAATLIHGLDNWKVTVWRH